MNAETVRKFVALDKQRRQLKEELAGVEGCLTKLTEQVLAEFEQAGVSTLRQDGTTVYVQRQLWANPKNGDFARASAALRDCGLGDMVQERVNTNTISAYFRELDREGKEPPDTMAAAFNVAEVFSIRTRTT